MSDPPNSARAERWRDTLGLLREFDTFVDDTDIHRNEEADQTAELLLDCVSEEVINTIQADCLS